MPSRVNISTVELGLSYSPTRRFAVSFGVPLSTGTHSGAEDDKARHVVSATGVGDVSLVGAMWLLDPAYHRERQYRAGSWSEGTERTERQVR